MAKTERNRPEKQANNRLKKANLLQKISKEYLSRSRKIKERNTPDPIGIRGKIRGIILSVAIPDI